MLLVYARVVPLAKLLFPIVAHWHRGGGGPPNTVNAPHAPKGTLRTCSLICPGCTSQNVPKEGAPRAGGAIVGTRVVGLNKLRKPTTSTRNKSISRPAVPDRSEGGLIRTDTTFHLGQKAGEHTL